MAAATAPTTALALISPTLAKGQTLYHPKLVRDATVSLSSPAASLGRWCGSHAVRGLKNDAHGLSIATDLVHDRQLEQLRRVGRTRPGITLVSQSLERPGLCFREHGSLDYFSI